MAIKVGPRMTYDQRDIKSHREGYAMIFVSQPSSSKGLVRKLRYLQIFLHYHHTINLGFMRFRLRVKVKGSNWCVILVRFLLWQEFHDFFIAGKISAIQLFVQRTTSARWAGINNLFIRWFRPEALFPWLTPMILRTNDHFTISAPFP